MKLKPLILNYISYRKSMGEKFRTNECYLKAFSRYVGDDIKIEDVSIDMVAEFLYGNSSVTSAWFIKHTALSGFYEYAISRGFINCSPLPTNLPKDRRHLFLTFILVQNCVNFLERHLSTKKTEAMLNLIWSINF